MLLTDGIFETGAYGVPSKSQNATVLSQGGPSSTQCSNPICGNEYLVLCTVSKWRVVVGSKWMVQTECQASV